MINEELRGTLVLVHPELEYDPDGRKNEIGIIVNSDLENDNVLVSFQDNEYDLFTSDALLVLLPAEHIHQNLADLAYETSFPDLKALTQMDLFLRYGSGDTHFKALEIARDNKKIQPLCLESLTDQTRRDLSQYPER
jgi:hypothetical protein